MICESWHLFVTHLHRDVCCTLFKGTSTLNSNCTWSSAWVFSLLQLPQATSVRPIHSDSCSPANVPCPDPVGLPLDLPGETQSAWELRAAQIYTVWQSSIPSECATWTDSCSFILGGISSVLLELVWQSSGNSICVFPLFWQLWGVYKNGLLTVNKFFF